MLDSLVTYSTWFYRSWVNYGSQGFLRESKTWDPNALNVNLKGKTILVTGANSGLGKVVALEVAKRGRINFCVHFLFITSLHFSFNRLLKRTLLVNDTVGEQKETC